MTSRLCKALRSGPPALVLALVACSAPALGQTVFDPYNAAVGNYQNFATPTMPQNLALPGQARAAISLEKQAVFGNKVYSTPFERYMLDGYTETFPNSDSAAVPGSDRERGAGTLGAGIPYYLQPTRGVDRSFVANRKADRDFLAAREVRDRRFFEAIRETNPVKRARLLRRVNDPIDSSELALQRDLPLPPERGAGAADAEPRRPAGSFRIARSPESGLKSPLATDLEPRDTRPPARMPMADEKLPPQSGPASTMPPASRPLGSLDDVLSRPGPSRVSPPPPTSVSPSRRRPTAPGGPRRPLLPSEMIERDRTQALPSLPR